MEHGSNGRRGVRDGAVSVAELVTRQPRSRRGAAREELPEGPLKPGGPFEQDSPRATRVTMGIIGLVLMLTSAMAVSVIIALPSPTTPQPGLAHPAISGVPALRPDLVLRAGWPFQPSNGFDDTQPGHSPETHEEDLVSATANPKAGSPDSALQLVRDFYRLLDDNSDHAMLLVSPALLSPDHRDEVARAWDSMTFVQPQRVERLWDGCVVADVTADPTDGGRLMLRHRFTVQLGATPQIVGVELVAANYSPPQ